MARKTTTESKVETKKKTTKAATKKVEKKNKDIKNIDTSTSETKALEVVNVLEVAENTAEAKKKKKKNNPSYLLFKHFITRLKEDKLYFLSFIITIAFFGIFSLSTLKKTEGYYDRKKDSSVDTNVTVPADPTLKNPTTEETPAKSDDIDVSDYVGIYSREIALTEPLKITSTCEIKSYKYIYKINQDKTITKYLINDCLGTIKIWSDKLSYVSTGGARYISANNINFLFSASSMKEVDADTYKIDDDIDTIRENNKISSLETHFYNNSIILNTKKDLILIKGNTVSYQLSKEYNTETKLLDQTVFQSSKDNVFRFISYEDKDETTKCVTSDSDTEDTKTLYKTYSIKYNEEEATFGKPKEIIERDNKTTCDILDEDIASLSE